MKVLTIKQPWATLISTGIKQYEIRSWKTNYRGPMLIHAGVGIAKEDLLKYKDTDLLFPKKEIICEVSLVDCIKITDEVRKDLLKENEKLYYFINDFEGYAWKLELVRIINIPNISGKLGMWNYELKEDYDVK